MVAKYETVSGQKFPGHPGTYTHPLSGRFSHSILVFQFGDSQKLRLVRILRSTVMVRVGGGWVALDEFLVKNDPCRGMFGSLLNCSVTISLKCVFFTAGFANY